MADIRYASGAIHDTAGPVTSIIPETQRGREWLAENMGWDIDTGRTDGAALIETSEIQLVLACMEADGITFVAA